MADKIQQCPDDECNGYLHLDDYGNSKCHKCGKTWLVEEE